jgi:cysteine desulfuration protein SufE
LVYIILKIFSGASIDELKNTDTDIVFDLKLTEIVTPNRQSGVIGMIKKIKDYIQKV